MDKRRRVYPTYEEAQNIVKQMGVESVKMYKSQYQKLSLPSNPNLYYEDNGWKGWNAFLGKETKSFPKYDEAKRIVQEKGVKSRKMYMTLFKTLALPSEPERCYMDKGWTDWFDFLGLKKKKAFPTYEEAKEIVKERGIITSMMYTSQAKELGLPTNPHLTYEKEWINWASFLENKTTFPTYKEAQRIVQGKGIRNVCEYKSLCKDLGLPVQPSRQYSDCGWVSWYIFLGKEKNMHPSYDEAKKIVQEKGVKSRKDYKTVYKTLALPAHPEEYYKKRGWGGWRDFFGKTLAPKDREYSILKRLSITPSLLKDAPLKVLYIFFSKFGDVTKDIESILGASSYEERLNWVKEQLKGLKDSSPSKIKSSDVSFEEIPDELSAMESIIEENNDITETLSKEEADRFKVTWENYVHSVINRELISELDDR